MSEVYTSIDEVLPVLRNKLVDYLSIKLKIAGVKKPFKCLWHDDEGRPNMILNPKNGYQTAHCFSCLATKDIFTFAQQIEGLPSNGPEWITTTIPSLCETLKIECNFGEPSPAQKEKSKLLKLCRDIADILESIEYKDSYGEERHWDNKKITMASIEEATLIQRLTDNGWTADYIISCGIIKTKKYSFFGKDKFTFVIENAYRQPIAFISRCLAENAEEKFIHTFDNSIFKKEKTLFGVGIDVQKCKTNGIYIVEGPGDVATLVTAGITNVAAAMGTAVSEDHLLELKKLGIRKVVLCLDWDKAGEAGTKRTVDNIFPKVQDISYYIKQNPNNGSKDPDDFIKNGTPEQFITLPELSIFEWQLVNLKDTPVDQLCELMVKTIASEPSAVRRSLMEQQLAKFTTIPAEAIENDVSTLRDFDANEKKNAIMAVGQEFLASLEKEPDNFMTLSATLEEQVSKIEKRYNKAVVGINYQLQRYDDIQKFREQSSKDQDFSSFKFNYYKDFGEVMSGGMPYTRACLIYFGGRSNAGKTLSILALGCDVALYDENAMTIIHSIDDSYEQIEPRIKTNVYNMYYPNEDILTLDMVVSPWKYDVRVKDMVRKADELLKQLLIDERLVILDGNDGTNLTALEKQWRYYRTRYPSRKLLGICDNTHDYEDFSHLDRTARMTMISSTQKRLATKYNACLIATAEYRKADRSYSEKIIFPTNDDLADARALSYRPNAIFHVYNDLADRGDKAEIFWIDRETGEKRPRLLWLCTKNKINPFKGKLVRDVDPKTVMCMPKNLDEAKREWEDGPKLPEEIKRQIEDFDEQLGYTVDAEYTGD